MWLGLTFLGLLCSLICVSNVAPAGEVDELPYTRVPYTKEEDQLIVNELTKMLNVNMKPHSRIVWDKIAKKHYKKWNERTPGFPHERSAESLHDRFKHVLITNNAETVVPDALIQKFNEEVSRHPYTKEEDDFITEELSKPSYTYVFTASTYATLLAELRKKHESKIPGFEHVRTPGSLRNHLMIMKNARQFPEKVLRKYHPRGKGVIRGQSSTSKQQTGLQISNEGRNDDDMIADMIVELQNNSDYEMDFSKLE